MSSAETTLSGRVVRITFANPENGYTVAKVQPPDASAPLTVVGRMPGLVEGQEITVRGRSILHPKFGPQIEAEDCHIQPPRQDEGVRRYLASGLIKGVGPKLAERLVEHLGEGALGIILEEPQRLAEVPGIGPKKAAAIRQAVSDHGQLRELMVFLQGHGVPASTALRIHRRYGAGALGVVQNAPHRLAADVRGIGFATADRIAAQVGIARDDPMRLQAGLLHALLTAQDEGHLFLPRGELIPAAAAVLGLSPDLLEEPLARLLAAGDLVAQDFPGGQAVYPAALAALEDRAAEHVAALIPGPGLLPANRAARAVEWVASQLDLAPSPGQAAALEGLLRHRLAILTGGPGTGKTTLVRALITIALRLELCVALAAPTGRAAKRLSESTGQPASTLHRLLEYQPKENRFARRADSPLEADLVVVDEVSMMDTWLFTYLLEAIGPDTRLILVGDADQLPSVGPGLVLRQLIESGVVAVARLSEIFRQGEGSSIVVNAHRILAGRMPQLPAPGEEGDFFFIEERDPAKAAELIADLVCRRIPQRFGCDPQADIQVLAPMHRGHLGCSQLNQLLRAQLNPGAAGVNGLAPGDRVLQVRNNYELEVFNGDMGRVEAAGDDGLEVSMGDRVLDYTPAEGDDLTLAYAVTVHKSQGSEYPAVVIALGMEHYILLNRQLLYTAVTRGKRLVVIVGHGGALRRAVEVMTPMARHALLGLKVRDRIKNAQKEAKP